MKKLLLFVSIVFSTWGFGQSILMNNGSYSVCTGQFESSTGFGSGGAGTPGYTNNENYVITFCPGVGGNLVSLNFASCVLGAGDVLTVYNGNSTAAPILGVYDATNPLLGIISAITATNPSGCITFQFISDAAGIGNGWTASISCVVPCQPFEIESVSFFPDTTLGGFIDVCDVDTALIEVGGVFYNNDLNYHQSDSNVTYYWYLDTTIIDSGTTISFPPDSAGAFLLQVFAIDSLGCQADYNLNFWIRVSTEPDFTPSFFTNDTICFGESNSLTYGALSQSWSNADSSTSNPTTFLPDGSGSNPGVYVNTLTFSKFPTGDTISSVADITRFWAYMEHTFLGDLTISMTCPNGSTTILKNFPGGGGTNLGEPCNGTGIGNGYLYEWKPTGNNQTNMTAYLCGCPAVNSPCTGLNIGASLPSDSYNAFGPMTNMIGCPLNGTWSLTIIDQWAADDGYLFAWGVDLDSSLYPTTVISYDPGIDTIWVDTALNAITTFSNGDSMVFSPTLDSTTYCYTINVLDGFGCTHDTTLCFFVRDMCDPVCYNPTGPTFGEKKVSCPGGSDGELYAYPNSAQIPMPWTFIWKDLSGQTLQTTVSTILPDTIVGLSQGTYTLEIIDGNGCSSIWTKPLGTVNSMQVNVVGVSLTSCATNTCDATASAVVFNGTSPYSYLWSSGDSLSMATSLCAGLNYLFVTDANGCVDTSAFTVNTPNPISVSAFGDTTICVSNTTNIGSNPTGGTPPYSFNWNAGLSTMSNVNVSPGTTQTYWVVVTDVNNCPADSDSVVVTVRPPLSLTFPNPDTVCPGDTSTLFAVPAGGDGFYNFVWEQGLGTTAGVLVQVSTSQFYSITLTDGCGTTPAVDSVWLQVGGFPPLKVDVTPDDTICIGDPFYLFAQGIGGDRKYTYEWDNGLGFGQTHAVKPTQYSTYTVTVTDQCLTPAGVGSVTVNVGNFEDFNPLVDTIQNCDPGTFVFGFDTLNSKFLYEMNFGDGFRIVDPFSPIERTFTEDGCRDISVKLTTDYGCITQKNYPCFVTVLPRPVANFDFESHQPDINEFAVDFWDKSTGATQWTWFADQTLLSEDEKFTHLFPNDGTYNIKLVVNNEYDCRDSLDTDLRVRFVTNYYIPTAFTPNGDQINDDFTIVGEGVQSTDFEMYIYDRWGGEVFYTNQLSVPWNGKFQNSGDEMSTGTYTYVITFRINTGRKITEFGNVNLLK